jgi:glycosyltransferase involved in cell wall biosynthesis
MTKLMLPSELIDDYHAHRKQRRRGFAFVGRISPYKGLDFLLSSWETVQSQLPPDEYLTIIGHGELPKAIPPRVIVKNRSFSDFEAIDIFRSSRAVILPYREASQSGVQVAAMQYGSPLIVTRVGALPEFQPSNQPSVEYGDEPALREHILRFAAMSDFAQESINSRAQYERNHSDVAVKKGLSDLLGVL